MTEEMKRQMVTFYENVKKHYVAYHDNKQTAAWAGVLLYIVFCGFVADVKFSDESKFLTALAATALIVFVLLVITSHVKNQLGLKSTGSEYVSASYQVLSEIISTPPDGLDAKKYLEVVPSNETKLTSRHVLPKYLLDKADSARNLGRGAEDITRRNIYWILALVTVGAMALIWSNLR